MENIYVEEDREEMLENGIINEFEEGFMQGYCNAVAMEYY
jgi:hypothetical protein